MGSSLINGSEVGIAYDLEGIIYDEESLDRKVFLTLAATLAIAPASAQQQRNPERNAYFGETHIHTAGRSTPTFSATR